MGQTDDSSSNGLSLNGNSNNSSTSIENNNNNDGYSFSDWAIDHPSVSSFDLDIIKLSAQFAARNGGSFQVGLWNRESKNPQFSFLQPVHPYHQYYLRLVEDYKKALLPEESIFKYIKENNVKNKIISSLMKKAEDEKKRIKEEEERRKEKEKENAILSSIDWYDFIVVEKIDFDIENDILPKPIKQSQVMDLYVAIKEDEIMKKQMKEEIKKMEFTKDESMKVEEVTPEHKPITTTTTMPQQSNKQVVACPICKQAIPVDEIDEHMKIELSRSGLGYEERRRKQEQERETVYASGNEVATHLSKLAKKRTDIFGTDEDIQDVGKEDEIEEKKRKEKVIWDGHTSSIQRTAKELLGTDYIENQRAAINAVKGTFVETKTIGPQFEPKHQQPQFNPNQMYQQQQMLYPQQPPPPYVHPMMMNPYMYPMMMPNMYPPTQQQQQQQTTPQENNPNKKQKTSD